MLKAVTSLFTEMVGNTPLLTKNYLYFSRTFVFANMSNTQSRKKNIKTSPYTNCSDCITCIFFTLMPKTPPLCTGFKLNLGDRVLGEIE